MSIVDNLLENKDAIQSIVNEIDCSNDKWFMYNHLRNENPILRNYSIGMTSRIMEKGPETFRSRFIFLDGEIYKSRWWLYKKGNI